MDIFDQRFFLKMLLDSDFHNVSSSPVASGEDIYKGARKAKSKHHPPKDWEG